jgi:NAD(P) transhydrogenase subunit beta
MEMEDANNEMGSTDVLSLSGANDVVNPAAEDDPSSPIAGMPVIQVWNAKNVIVMKRSMAKGYAAIENKLFSTIPKPVCFSAMRRKSNHAETDY